MTIMLFFILMTQSSTVHAWGRNGDPYKDLILSGVLRHIESKLISFSWNYGLSQLSLDSSLVIISN